MDILDQRAKLMKSVSDWMTREYRSDQRQEAAQLAHPQGASGIKSSMDLLDPQKLSGGWIVAMQALCRHSTL